MATKAEEMKALEQIKKIIASLGENSYIATAMDGMIEDAEENIENDFALSMKERYLDAQCRCMENEKQIESLKSMNANQEKMIEFRDEWLKQKNDRIDDLNNQLEGAAKDISGKFSEIIEKQQRIADLELETMKLKAKLYDLIA